MKKLLLFVVLLVCSLGTAMAQDQEQTGPAEIKFEKMTHNFGKFSVKDPVVKCTFNFTNVGGQPLIINQAVASCGCTVPKYTKEPIMPGKSGQIEVTYNGSGKPLGHFRKSITVRTNGKEELTRVYIEGDMVKADELANE